MAQIVVVGRMLVGVPYYESYRRAGGTALEHAGEQFHCVGLLTGCRYGRLAGAAAAHLPLYLLDGESHAGRDAVEHAAEGGAMAFAKCGEGDLVAECIHISLKR